MTSLLEIENLSAEIEGKQVLKDVCVTINAGEVHALLGKNGSGKSSLSNVIMGHPMYKVTAGQILFKGEDITSMPTDERAKRRLFLAFQNPIAIPGVSVANFLRTSIRAVRGSELAASEVRKQIQAELKRLSISESFMTRHLNDGFSGGEKKKLEALQMRLLRPSLTILDETDSGLDVDALKLVTEAISELKSEENAFLVISHYSKMLELLSPTHVHVLQDGRIVRSGSRELLAQVEAHGFEGIAEPIAVAISDQRTSVTT